MPLLRKLAKAVPAQETMILTIDHEQFTNILDPMIRN